MVKFRVNKRIGRGKSTMFPEYLDGAKVLYYTPEDDYGVMYYTTGEISAYFKYLAICKYDNDDGYYLFYCNENKEVESDDLWDSVDECMKIADCFCGRNVLWIKKAEWNK